MSTRAEEISKLHFRYMAATEAGKRKEANILFARMSALVLRQLKAEERAEKRMRKAA